MDLIIVIAGLLSFVIIGLSVLSFLDVKLEILPKSAFGFGIGASVVSLTLILYSFLNLPISFFTVIAPWYLIFLYQLKEKKVVYKNKINDNEFVLIDYLMLSLIFVCVLLSLIYPLLTPVSSWDAVATWSALAKSFFYERSLGIEIFRFFNVENPPIIFLQQALLSILNGEYNDKEAMLLYSGYFVSLIIIFYYSLKRISTVTNALLFTFLLSSLPLLLGQAGRYNVGYVDLPLAYFIFSATMMLLSYIFSPSVKASILLALYVSMLPLVKNEGLSVCLIITLIALAVSLRLRRLRDAACILCGLIPVLLWKFYTVAQSFPVHPLYNGSLMISRTPDILKGFLNEIFNLANWNILWVVFLISLALLVYVRSIKIVLLILSIQIVFYFFTYIYMPSEVLGQIDSTLDRFLLHISPLALYVIASAFAKPSIYNEKQK